MNNEKFSKVVEQIRKLLALGQSSNIHESALAIQKAKEIMLKYNISELDLEENVSDIIEIDLAYSNYSEDFTLKFAYHIGKAFNVRPIQILCNTSQDKIKFERAVRFVGRYADVAVSTYIFSYILSLLKIKAEGYGGKKKGKKDIIRDYSIGFITAVCVKLQTMEEERIAGMTMYEEHPENKLVVIANQLINSYIKEKYSDTLHGANEDKKQQVNDNDFENGFIEGQKQGIYNGIEGKETTRRLK